MRLTAAALNAAADSLEAQAAVLRALAAEISAESDDERWATAEKNPLGNAWTFRRLCREGAFPCVLGPRKQKRAKWSDVVAYVEAQAYTPTPRAKDDAQEIDPFEKMLRSGSVVEGACK